MSGGDQGTPPGYTGRSRRKLLRLLSASGKALDATEVGRMAGLHRNSARAHLEALVSDGLVRRRSEPRVSRGRPRVLYEAIAPPPESQAGEKTTALGYIDLAQALAGQLTEVENVAGEAIRAGRRWAAAVDASPLEPGDLTAQAAMRTVCDLFDRLGFGPELSAGEGRIRLHRCPFAAVAAQARPVVCGMHLGMLKATLERIGAPLEVSEFQPLVQGDPLLCVVGFREKAPETRRGPSRARSLSTKE